MRFVIHADDGQPVQLQRTGRGRPLVLLHEWTADHSVWRRFTPALADSFTVHAWDARGHGATGSEHSQTTAAAISSGLPIRPTGSCAITIFRPSGVPPLKRSIIGVSMIPGHTALTRMFDGT